MRPRRATLVRRPHAALATCTRCQALLTHPRRFQMLATLSGCTLYAASTARADSTTSPRAPAGTGTVACAPRSTSSHQKPAQLAQQQHAAALQGENA